MRNERCGSVGVIYHSGMSGDTVTDAEINKRCNIYTYSEL